ERRTKNYALRDSLNRPETSPGRGKTTLGSVQKIGRSRWRQCSPEQFWKRKTFRSCSVTMTWQQETTLCTCWLRRDLWTLPVKFFDRKWQRMRLYLFARIILWLC
ncbi:hypothetical protein GOP47_0031089, partial [Adiantum capillus-veneris]